MAQILDTAGNALLDADGDALLDTYPVAALAAETRAYTLTGSAAGLTKTGGDLVAETQAYTLTGNAAAISRSVEALDTDVQTYTTSFPDAGLVVASSPQLVGYVSATDTNGGTITVDLTTLTTGANGVGNPIEDGDLIIVANAVAGYGGASSLSPMTDYLVTTAGFSTLYDDVDYHKTTGAFYYTAGALHVAYMFAESGSIPTSVTAQSGGPGAASWSSAALQAWVLRGVDPENFPAAAVAALSVTGEDATVDLIDFATVTVPAGPVVAAVSFAAGASDENGSGSLISGWSLSGMDDDITAVFANDNFDTTMASGVKLVAPAGSYTPASADPWYFGDEGAGVLHSATVLAAGAMQARFTLDASAGAITLTGQAADFAHPNRQINPPAATFTLQGVAASITQTNNDLPADAQSYAIAGNPVALVRGHAVAASAGSYDLTGQTTGLTAARVTGATVQTYALTGQPATMAVASGFAVDTGAVALTGQSADLLYSRVLSGAVQPYAVTGVAADLLGARGIAADAQAYALTGVSPSVVRELSVPAQTGEVVLASPAVTFSSGYSFVATPQAYVLTGVTQEIVASNDLRVDPGTFTIDGKDAGVTLTKAVLARVQTYVLSGQAATFAHVVPSVGRVAADNEATNYVDGVSVFNSVSDETGKNALSTEDGQNSVS